MIDHNLVKDEIDSELLNPSLNYEIKQDEVLINWLYINKLENKLTETKIIEINNLKFTLLLFLNNENDKFNLKIKTEFPEKKIEYFKINNFNKILKGNLILKNSIQKKYIFKKITIDPKINNDIFYDCNIDLEEIKKKIDFEILIEIKISLKKFNYDENCAIYCGLINFGCICYLNSYIQFLFFCKTFVNNILNLFNKGIKDELLDEMTFLFYFLSKSKQEISPMDFIKALGYKETDMLIQEDVQEFSIKLLDKIENICKSNNEEIFIKNIFEGELESYIKCINVECESKRKDNFFDIQLKVAELNNLYESFDNYLLEEKLDGDNKYDAEKFGKQDALKGIRFNLLPDVLVLHLRRFEFDFIKMTNVKIFSKYEFFEEINLNKYVNPEYNKDDNEFILFSTFIHIGSNSGMGHYINFIKTDLKNWYEFDDENVKSVDWEYVKEYSFGGFQKNNDLNNGDFNMMKAKNKNSQAYLLVYLKKNKLNEILKDYDFNKIPNNIKVEFDKKIELKNARKFQDFYCNIYFKFIDDLKNEKGNGILWKRNTIFDEESENNFYKTNKYEKIILKKEFKFLVLRKYISELYNIKENTFLILYENNNNLLDFIDCSFDKKDFFYFNLNENSFNLYFLIYKIEDPYSNPNKYLKENKIIILKEINENNELVIIDHFAIKDPYEMNLIKSLEKYKYDKIYFEYEKNYENFLFSYINNERIISLSLVLEKNYDLTNWEKNIYHISNLELANRKIKFCEKIKISLSENFSKIFEFLESNLKIDKKRILLIIFRLNEKKYIHSTENLKISDFIQNQIVNFKIWEESELLIDIEYKYYKIYIYNLLFLNPITIKYLLPSYLQSNKIMEYLKNRNILQLNNILEYNQKFINRFNDNIIKEQYESIILERNNEYQIGKIENNIINLIPIINIGNISENYLVFQVMITDLNEFYIIKINRFVKIFRLVEILNKILYTLTKVHTHLKEIMIEKPKKLYICKIEQKFININDPKYSEYDISFLKLNDKIKIKFK